jgi:hydroxypyruvate isomerase
MRKFCFFVIIFLLTIDSSNAQISQKYNSKKVNKGLFGITFGKKKEAKGIKPLSAGKAKKKQEAKDRKLKKDYAKSVKMSQKRTIDIQTPEVQARMLQNKKDSKMRDKLKKKKVKASTKKAGEKYK